MNLIEPLDTWVEVGRPESRAEAEQLGLVLVAAGINCRIEPRAGQLRILVPPEAAVWAIRELAGYARENQAVPPRPLKLRPFGKAVLAAIPAFCVLMFVEGAARRGLFGFDWLRAGAANAGDILAGEWWRSFTALTLHADFGHIASNLIAGVLLGIVLAQLLGGGVTWLAILLAGGFGNLLSAFFHTAGHSAIGASTSVFGALGILAALMTVHRRTIWRRGLRRFLPLIAGAVLLALFGLGGERIDVGGHVGGFVAGAILGASLAVLGPPGDATPARTQIFAGAAAFAIIVVAWAVALSAF